MTAPSPDLIEMVVGDARLRIDPLGSRVVSLMVGDDELLVPPGPDPLLSGCYPMVPWAGRLGQARFDFDGRTHQLPVDHPPHAIHGLGTGATWVRTHDATLELALGDRWPFGGVATTRFDLQANRCTMALEFRAGESAAPVVLGWHPCFRRRLEPGSTLPAIVGFEAASMWGRGDHGLPTGESVTPPPGPWDDCFSGVVDPPQLAWPGGPTVTLQAPTDTWVVFDEQDHAVCVEPQTAPPDAFNLGGAARLDPGRSISLPLSVVWSG